MKQWYADSTLKSMTKENLIGIIRCLEHNVSVEEERNQNQFNLLMKHEKYRWHDLRKNPNDLPERAISMTGERTCHESDDVLAVDGANYNFIAMYNHDCGKWFDATNYWEIVDGRIIAWREIEPFE